MEKEAKILNIRNDTINILKKYEEKLLLPSLVILTVAFEQLYLLQKKSVISEVELEDFIKQAQELARETAQKYKE